MKDRLIVALDVPSLKEARRFVCLLKEKVSLFKVGLELFTAVGPDVVRMIHDEGGRVFLDLKFHDIPNTVARACEAADRLGVFMMNLHACGGQEMLKAAESADRKFLLLGVTVLTSDRNLPGTSDEVVRLAKECRRAGLSGVVCSAREAKAVRKACGPRFLIVTPGIRPSGASRDDQKRVVTPSQAIREGADYIVVGRPILSAADPLQMASSIVKEIASPPN